MMKFERKDAAPSKRIRSYVAVFAASGVSHAAKFEAKFQNKAKFKKFSRSLSIAARCCLWFLASWRIKISAPRRRPSSR